MKTGRLGAKQECEREISKCLVSPNVLLFWFIQTLRGSSDIKQHTFNPRLAVPQPARTRKPVTLACYKRPSTPPQAPLSRGSLVLWKKHCCGTLTSLWSASWQNGFKSLIWAHTLIMQHIMLCVIVLRDLQWERHTPPSWLYCTTVSISYRYMWFWTKINSHLDLHFRVVVVILKTPY